MEYIEYSHRHAKAIIDSNEKWKKVYNEFIGVIESITDEEVMADFEKRKAEKEAQGKSLKSVSTSLNHIIKNKIIGLNGPKGNDEKWESEVEIFKDNEHKDYDAWRLDFAYTDVFCVEIAFNHGEAIAWNLLKPVIACELNHVEKEVQGKIGIYVCATDKMKKSGNFDSASGSYEKVLTYLEPMMNQLTIPMIIIGLEPFKTFKILKNKQIIKSDFDLANLKEGKKYKVIDNDFKEYEGEFTKIIVEKNGNETNRKVEFKSGKSHTKYDELAIKFIEELKENNTN